MSGLNEQEQKVRFSLDLESYNMFKEGLEDDPRADYGEIVEVDKKEYLVIYFKNWELCLEVEKS